MGHVKHLYEVEGDNSKELTLSRERSILGTNSELLRSPFVISFQQHFLEPIHKALTKLLIEYE